MKNQKTLKCMVSVILIALIPGLFMCVNAQPQGGDWKIQTEFGEMALTVSPKGTSITKLSVTFSDYTCGGVTQNGTVSKQNAAGWSISDNQFAITTTINPSGTIRITVAGTFSQAGNKATGTWNLNVSGTNCSGTWSHTISNGDIPEAKWKSIGPYMGYINALEMDNAHPDTVYAASPHGLFRTMDAAENWIKVNLPEIKIDKVVVSQSHSNHVICASEYNVFSSSDYGFNWDVIWSDTVRIECITFNPENPNTILIGTDNRFTTAGFEYGENTAYFFKSTNGGNTWGKINFKGIDSWHIPESVKYLVVDPSDTSKIYVGTKNSGWGAVFVSHDNGMNWDNVRLTGSSEEVYALSCTPKGYEDHTVCAIAAKSTAPDLFYRKLFISKNAGLTWEHKVASSSFDFLENANYESTMYISEDFPKYVHIGVEYKSEDVRSSVAAFNLEDEKWYYYRNAPNSFPTSILFCNERYYLGFSNKGVYKNMGNNNWLSKNKGMQSVKILDLAYYPKVPGKLLVAVPGNLQKTNNMGLSWEKLEDTGWNRNSIFVNRNDTSKIIAGTDPDKYLTYGSSYYIYKSENGGNSWNSQVLFTRYGNSMYNYKMWTGDINGPQDNSEIVFIGIDGGDSSSGTGLYKSSDGGNSWSKKYSNRVSTIAVDPKNSNLVYLGTNSLRYIYRSDDWGDNWNKISPLPNAFVISVWDIQVDNKGQVFAATTSGLLTWEGDTTWTLLPEFPTTNTSVIAIDNTTEVPVYYVGTSGLGVFVSSDGGSTWESFNDGLDRKNITKLKISDSSPKYLYAGTSNGGVWVTRLEEIPTGYSSFQKPEHSFTIFPNPNKGLFYFRLDSNPPERIAIKLVNSLGQVVETRILHYPSANHTEQFNLSYLSKGAYYFVVSSEKMYKTEKIIIY